jgi:hypothetical protein
MIWSSVSGHSCVPGSRFGGPASEVPSRVLDKHTPVPLSIHFDDLIDRDEPSVPGHPRQDHVEIPLHVKGHPIRNGRKPQAKSSRWPNVPILPEGNPETVKLAYVRRAGQFADEALPVATQRTVPGAPVGLIRAEMLLYSART